jgi:hypothetical protein
MLPMITILRPMVLIWAVEGAATWSAPPNHSIYTYDPVTYNYLYLTCNFLATGTILTVSAGECQTKNTKTYEEEDKDKSPLV